MKNIGAWVYSHERQTQVNPATDEGLTSALARLWESEIGGNTMAIAMQLGVAQSLRVAMGATLVWAITNDDEAFETYRAAPGQTPSGLTIATSTEGIDGLASTMEALRGDQR